jgi:hypothetical protein
MTPHRSDVGVPLPDGPAAERASVAEEAHGSYAVARKAAVPGGASPSKGFPARDFDEDGPWVW